jgi:hypothetical protein
MKLRSIRSSWQKGVVKSHQVQQSKVRTIAMVVFFAIFTSTITTIFHVMTIVTTPMGPCPLLEIGGTFNNWTIADSRVVEAPPIETYSLAETSSSPALSCPSSVCNTSERSSDGREVFKAWARERRFGQVYKKVAEKAGLRKL